MKYHLALLTVMISIIAILGQSEVKAEEMKPDEQISFRKATFKFMAFNMGRIKKNIKGSHFDPDAVKIAAQAIQAAAATHIEQLFGENTDQSDQYDVKARPEIWMMKDKFITLAQKHRQASKAMAIAAQSADPDKVRSAFTNLAQSCKACHRDFKFQ